MSLTLNITDHWSDGKRIHVTGTLVPAGVYATGGDVIPLNLPTIKSASPPVFATAEGFGYDYLVVLGTTLSNSKLKVTVSSTGLELAAGAYPAAMLTNPIIFYGIFPKFI